jgi:hypothetical protein
LLAIAGALQRSGRVPLTGADWNEAESFCEQVRAVWNEAEILVGDATFQKLVPPPPRKAPYDDFYVGCARMATGAVRTVDSLVAYLRAVVQDPEREAERLTAELEETRSSLELAKGWLDTLRGAGSYGIQPDDPRLKKLTDSERRLFLDAATAYDHGAYAAAVCVCGTVAEGLVTRICAAKALSGGSFGEKVRVLRENGILKKQYNDLLGIVTTYRTLSAHPSPEEFNRQKAGVVLDSTLILVDELLT